MKKINIAEMVRRFAILRRELNRGLITLTEYNDETVQIVWDYFYAK